MCCCASTRWCKRTPRLPRWTAIRSSPGPAGRSSSTRACAWRRAIRCLRCRRYGRRTMTDTLTALDATFLELEEQSEGALMHTGGVMVFDPLPAGGAPRVEDLCALVTGRLAGLPRC